MNCMNVHRPRAFFCSPRSLATYQTNTHTYIYATLLSSLDCTITSGMRVAAAISLASSSDGSPAVGATLAAKPGRSSCMLGDDATAVTRPRRCDARKHCAAAGSRVAGAGLLLEAGERLTDGLAHDMSPACRGAGQKSDGS